MNSKKMKLLRGKHSFKNYQELCAALEIDPAKRGSDRDKQKEEIRKEFFLTENKNGTYVIEKKTKEDRAAEIEQEKKRKGQMVLVDGHLVDLHSTLCYQGTHIDKLIEYMAIINYNRFNTKSGFVTACFERTKLFKELLAKGNTALRSKHQKESLQIVQEYTLSKLSSMLETNLCRMEKAKRIEIYRGYEDSNGNWHEIEEVKPYIEKALKFVGLKREFQVYVQPYEVRNMYHQKRNELFEAEHGEILSAKRMLVEPLVKNNDADAPKPLNNKDIQIILTAFFDIFREKVRYDITCKRKSGFGDTMHDKRMLLEKYGDEALEIIDEYCAYATAPRISGEQSVTFYSLKELEDYYKKTISKSNTTIVFDSLAEYSDEDLERIAQSNDDIFDERDAPCLYDEVNGHSNENYDYYALIGDIPF